jgi:VWFA-related protein
LVTAAFLAAAFAVALPAQDGVAGGTPVFSDAKKAPPDKDHKKVGEEPNKIRIQSPLVTTPVTVIDSSGEFIYDLQEDDFRVLDNGVPQQLERFQVEVPQLVAVIVLQSNQNIAPLLDQVRHLAAEFSTLLLGNQGRAAVIFFDDRVRVAQDFANGDRLASTFEDLMPRGDKARLNDALMRAIEMLEKQPREQRRVIIALSDGYDAGSETKKDEVVRQSTSAEVTIYGLGFNPVEELLAQKPELPRQSPLDTNVTRPMPPGGLPPTPTNSENVYSTPNIPVVPIVVATGEVIRSARASSLLEYYAGYTGGVFYSHWSKKALEQQLNSIASEINSQYELAYIPDTTNQTGFHRIEVQVHRPAVKVRARAGYFNPATDPGTAAPARPE